MQQCVHSFTEFWWRLFSSWRFYCLRLIQTDFNQFQMFPTLFQPCVDQACKGFVSCKMAWPTCFSLEYLWLNFSFLHQLQQQRAWQQRVSMLRTVHAITVCRFYTSIFSCQKPSFQGSFSCSLWMIDPCSNKYFVCANRFHQKGIYVPWYKEVISIHILVCLHLSLRCPRGLKD